MLTSMSTAMSALKPSLKRSQILILEPDLAVLDYLRMTLGSQIFRSAFSLKNRSCLIASNKAKTQISCFWRYIRIAIHFHCSLIFGVPNRSFQLSSCHARQSCVIWRW